MFAALYDVVVWPWERLGFRAMRRRLLDGARGRVVEIGAGTGANLELYRPERVDAVWAVEPDAAMRVRAERRRPIVKVHAVAAAGEALPFDDESFDTAVLTLVLCSVADTEAVLSELDRVLRPGGRLLLIEHVRSRRPAWRRVQHLLAPSWRRVAAGCRLDQDPEALVRRRFDVAERRFRDGVLPLLTIAADRRARG
jgi:ubiquinone/menaquinone biosynthesis C-methylase UbiE